MNVSLEKTLADKQTRTNRKRKHANPKDIRPKLELVELQITLPLKPGSPAQNHEKLKQSDSDVSQGSPSSPVTDTQPEPESRKVMDFQFIRHPSENGLQGVKILATGGPKLVPKHIVEQLEASNEHHMSPDVTMGTDSDSSSSHSSTSSGYETTVDIEGGYELRVESPPVRKRTPSAEVDLQVALGISPLDLAADKVTWRMVNIKNKMKSGSHILFSKFEEFDIHQRADVYSRTVTPDPDHCFLRPEHTIYGGKDTTINIGQLGKSTEEDQSGGPGRKKRRHSLHESDYYVIHPRSKQVQENDDSIILPQGMCLLRPSNKLVELVAHAINNSPDGMLQVQQVYLALQNKYPYFCYMDKGSTTSWRSSIRHALYQKWFRKIPFQSDVINCKGCYWAINRKHHPREWTLPPCKDESQDEDEDFGVCDLDNWNIIPSVSHYLADIEAVGSHFEVLNQDSSDLAQDGCDMGEVPPVDMTSSGERNVPAVTERDPDPMLTSNTSHIGDGSNHARLINDYLSSYGVADHLYDSDHASEDSGCSTDSNPTWWLASWDDLSSDPDIVQYSPLLPNIGAPSLPTMTCTLPPDSPETMCDLTSHTSLYWQALPLEDVL